MSWGFSFVALTVWYKKLCGAGCDDRGDKSLLAGTTGSNNGVLRRLSFNTNFLLLCTLLFLKSGACFDSAFLEYRDRARIFTGLKCSFLLLLQT